MDEQKIVNAIGGILSFFELSLLKPEENIVALQSAITIIDQIRIQTAVIENLSRAFAPVDKKTIN